MKQLIRAFFVQFGIGYAIGFAGTVMLLTGNPLGAVLMAATFIGYLLNWDRVILV